MWQHFKRAAKHMRLERWASANHELLKGFRYSTEWPPAMRCLFERHIAWCLVNMPDADLGHLERARIHAHYALENLRQIVDEEHPANYPLLNLLRRIYETIAMEYSKEASSFEAELGCPPVLYSKMQELDEKYGGPIDEASFAVACKELQERKEAEHG